MAHYRDWPYATLLAVCERRDVLEAGFLTAETGERYALEICVVREDRSQGTLRVIGSLELDRDPKFRRGF